MSILEIIVIFLVFCVVWILTNAIWGVIEGRMLLKHQEQQMDLLYSKICRYILKGIRDTKDFKEVIKRDDKV